MNSPSPAGGVWAIVVAAGSGQRFGGPKQVARLGGQRVLDHALEVARAACNGVVLVVAPDRADAAEPVADLVVTGGATRSASVRAGLAAVPVDAEVVLVHDAARPLATVELFERVIDAVRSGADAAIPTVPVVDTLRSKDGTAVDRDTVKAVQTPQGFAPAALRSAHAGGDDATDDASLVERAGGVVVLVDGEVANIKITGRADLVVAEALLAARPSGGLEQRERSTDDPSPMSAPGRAAPRIGQGFDVHRLGSDPDRPLVLGGVAFPGPGLVGHSDGDVVAHACADALLGAAGLGDIGSLFPDDDPTWAGADSIELLRTVADRVRAAGFAPANIDCSVVLDAPRLAPQRDAMQRRLSDAVGAPVTVKGRRTEGLGALGRAEGVVCFANALVVATATREA